MRLYHESRDSLIMWLRDMQKKALSPPSLGQWKPILARRDLSWIEHKHRVTWLIYYVLTLYSQKSTSPVSQRQWPLNSVGLWVRVKGPHLLFQVTGRSSDHLPFEKRHVSPNARILRTQLEISNIEKLTSQKPFLLFKRY